MRRGGGGGKEGETPKEKLHLLLEAGTCLGGWGRVFLYTFLNISRLNSRGSLEAWKMFFISIVSTLKILKTASVVSGLCSFVSG